MTASPDVTAIPVVPPGDDGVTFLGHPVSLYVLFFAEFWERFSFYGMRALLVLYMADAVSGLSYTDNYANAIYGAYGSLVYATPAIGGLLADKLLGYRKAIVLGGVLMALGHFAMAVENTYFFFGALGLLILGNGFFKPNISSLVGKLYPDGDSRRDGAFTIFYMGINAGAFLAPFLCGGLAVYYGQQNLMVDGQLMFPDLAEGATVRAYHYGFGLAGVGMMLGLASFLGFQRHLGDKGLAPVDAQGNPPPRWAEIATYIAPLLVLPLIMWLVYQVTVAGWLLIIAGGSLFVGLFVWSFMQEKVERQRMWVILVLMFFSMLFWSFFEQAGSSLTLFAERNVNRDIGGFTVDTTWFQSVNPAFIILLAPLFAALWTRLDMKGRDPATPIKFGLGVIQLGLGFGLLWYGATHHTDGITSMTWLILGYLLHTTGELCLSPVGLSMVTKLSPGRMVGLVMGAWFLATAFSHYLAAMIAQLTGGGGHAGADGEVAALSATEAMQIYGEVFGGIALVAVVAGAVCLALSPLLTRWMHQDRDADQAPLPASSRVPDAM